MRKVEVLTQASCRDSIDNKKTQSTQSIHCLFRLLNRVGRAQLESYQKNSGLKMTKPHSLLARLPTSWIPYAELARLDKPIGTFVIYLPYPLGLLFAAITSETPVPTHQVHHLNTILLVASFLLRSAGCTWNDVADYKFDQKVLRCCRRPVARGAVSPHTGAVFFSVQILAWLAVMQYVSPHSVWYTIPNTVMVLFYPFAKRVTDYPQVVLGVTLAWGMICSSAILGGDPISLWRGNPRFLVGLAFLFAAYVAWTAVYDTVYAYQDIKDDEQAGVRSMAIRWQRTAKLLLIFLAILQVLLLVGVGLQVNASQQYFILACGGSAISQGVMIWKLQLRKAEDCGWWFKYGTLVVGICMLGGFLAEYFKGSQS